MQGLLFSGGIAFSAYSNHFEDVTYMLGDTMQFTSTWVNYGLHYNTHSGMFTCPCAGINHIPLLKIPTTL